MKIRRAIPPRGTDIVDGFDARFLGIVKKGTEANLEKE